jgi:transcriptional regulator with XRE-family HTH domain
MILDFSCLHRTGRKKATRRQKCKAHSEILGIKQDDLATRMGLTQQAVSQLGAKEALDRDILDKVAKAMGVNIEAIKNFSEEAAVNFFNTFNDNSVSHVISNYGTYNYNPIEKWMETLEENKKLYERLLQVKKKRPSCLNP